MKRILSLSFLAFLGLTTFASPRSAKQAQDVAKDFFSQRSDANQQKRVAPKQNKTLKLSYTAAIKTNAAPAYYVYNRGEGAGWVMVSGDTDVPEVLAYSNEGTFDYECLGDNTKYILSRYASQVERVQEGEKLLYTANASYEPIDALLGKRQWAQLTPFQDSCPRHTCQEHDNKLCVVGCVATAMAQIMAYHKHPAQGVGTISYEWTRDKVTTTLTRDFSQSTYDWKHMWDYYYATSSKKDTASDESKAAVAVLSRDCGYAVKMGFGPSGSGATTGLVSAALLKYFDYDAGIQTRPLKNYETEDYLDVIYAELAAARPVFMSASTSKIAHAYVIDGMDANGYIHINWGWRGVSDGYFLLTNMAPKEQGTGGDSDDGAYKKDISIFTGIQPNKGDDLAQSLTANSIDVVASTDNTNGASPATLKITNDRQKINVQFKTLRNTVVLQYDDADSRGYSQKKYSGYVGYNIVSNDGTVVRSGTKVKSIAMTNGYAYNSMSFTLPTLEDEDIGIYSLVPTFSQSDGSYEPIHGRYNVMPMVYKKDSVFVFGKESSFSRDYKPSSLNATTNADNQAVLSWLQTESLSSASYLVFVWDDSKMKYYKTSSTTLTLPVTYDQTYHWAVLPVNDADLAFSPVAYGDDFVVATPQVIPNPEPDPQPNDEPNDDPSDEPMDTPSDDPNNDAPNDDPSDEPTDTPSDDPNNDPSDEPSDDAPTAVDDVKEKGVDITFSENTITVTTATATSISLYDVEGQLLHQEHHTYSATFHVAKGVYIVATPEKKQKVFIK